MSPLEKVGIVVGIVAPALAMAWWAGAGYIEFNDRLEALERDAFLDEEFRRRYEREQAKDMLVNEQVKSMAEDVEWLKFHHHDEHGGRAHVD